MQKKSYKSFSIIVFIFSIFSFFLLASQHTHFVEAQVKVSSTNNKKDHQTIFNEIISKDSSFPQASLNINVSTSDLHEAMEQYYRHEYSNQEKKISQEKISKDELQTFYDQVMLNKSLAPLDIHVDTMTMTLDGDTLEIPRILISLPEVKAKTFVPDHDIMVLNEAMTVFGNRIIMVGYLDEKENTVVPLHLSNNTKSIFYNKQTK